MAVYGHKQWDSKSAVLAHLSESHLPHVLVAAPDEAPRRFDSFAVAASASEFEIVVFSANASTRPQVLELDGHRRALVGFDSFLCWIDLARATVGPLLRIEGIFFEFIPVERRDHVVVVHELGALRVDSTGNVLWRADTDVVESFRMEADTLVLELMDATEVRRVLLASGDESPTG